MPVEPVESSPEFAAFLFGDRTDAAATVLRCERVERRSLGRITLVDGVIHAGDALVPLDTVPFAERLPAGEYEVVVFVEVSSRVVAPQNQRNVAAALLVTNEPPVTWKRATRHGGGEDSGAYGVDTGTGCFVGSLGAATMYEDGMSGDLIMKALKTSSCALVSVANGTAHAAVFCTGDGDGVYESWWGYDAKGAIAILITDFDVFEMETALAKGAGKEVQVAPQKKWWEFWR